MVDCCWPMPVFEFHTPLVIELIYELIGRTRVPT